MGKKFGFFNQHMLQIRPGEGTVFHLVNAAVFGVGAKQRVHDHADPGLSLAAVALNEQHHLPPGAGNQAVAHEFLQSQNVLRLQKLRQKLQPGLRLRCFGIVEDGQAVQAEVLFLHEPAH